MLTAEQILPLSERVDILREMQKMSWPADRSEVVVDTAVHAVQQALSRTLDITRVLPRAADQIQAFSMALQFLAYAAQCQQEAMHSSLVRGGAAMRTVAPEA